MTIPASPFRPLSLKASLIGFGAVIGVLFVGFFVAAISFFAISDRNDLIEKGKQQNAELFSTVTGDLNQRLDALEALAKSPIFATEPDTEMLSSMAKIFVADSAISVVDTYSWTEIYSSRARTGGDFETSIALEQARAVERSGESLVSGLLPASSESGYSLAVSVPVYVDPTGLQARRDKARTRGQLRYVLSSFVAPSAFADLLIASRTDAGYFGSLADQKGRIVARTESDHQKTGDMLPGFGAIKTSSGVWEGINPQGVPVYGFWNRDVDTGWIMATGISKAVLEAPMWQSIKLAGMVAIAIAAILAGFLWSFMRRLRSMFGELSEAAQAMKNGEPVSIPTLPIVEANAIADALQTASVAVKREVELTREVNEALELRVSETTEELTEALAHAEAAEIKAEEAEREIKRAHATDDVTGLSNRKEFDAVLQAEFETAREASLPLSLVLVDIDRFKAINDTFGRKAGDAALNAVGEALVAASQSQETQLSRLGGGAFAILLPHAGRDDVMAFATRFRTSLGRGTANGALPAGAMTVSIGGAANSDASESTHDFYRSAEIALGEAQAAGGNTIRFAFDRQTEGEPENVFAFKAS